MTSLIAKKSTFSMDSDSTLSGVSRSLIVASLPCAVFIFRSQARELNASVILLNKCV